MQIPHNWQATAFNQSTQSANQIHSDEIARVYGFKGGLVPGVTVSSYLMHPAVVAWGERWLKRGRAHVLVKKPLYDGYRFDVELSDVTHGSYRAGLVDKNQTECASARVSLNEEVLVPPIRRGDPVMRRDR